MGKKFIVLGDTTSHGGTVVSASSRMIIDGTPVACVGDLVVCPKKGCESTFPIIEGASGPDTTLDGKPLAREGDKTACGASLISSGQAIATHGPDSGGSATAGGAAAKQESGKTEASESGASAAGSVGMAASVAAAPAAGASGGGGGGIAGMIQQSLTQMTLSAAPGATAASNSGGIGAPIKEALTSGVSKAVSAEKKKTETSIRIKDHCKLIRMDAWYLLEAEGDGDGDGKDFKWSVNNGNAVFMILGMIPSEDDIRDGAEERAIESDKSFGKGVYIKGKSPGEVEITVTNKENKSDKIKLNVVRVTFSGRQSQPGEKRSIKDVFIEKGGNFPLYFDESRPYGKIFAEEGNEIHLAVKIEGAELSDFDLEIDESVTCDLKSKGEQEYFLRLLATKVPYGGDSNFKTVLKMSCKGLDGKGKKHTCGALFAQLDAQFYGDYDMHHQVHAVDSQGSSSGWADQAVKFVQGIPIVATNKVSNINEVLKAIGAAPGYISQKIARKFVERQEWAQGLEKQLRLIASAAKRNKVGNCGEQSLVAFFYLYDLGVRPVEWFSFENNELFGGADHGYVVVGRSIESKAHDFDSWGVEAMICDPWEGEVSTPLQLKARWDHKAKGKLIPMIHLGQSKRAYVMYRANQGEAVHRKIQGQATNKPPENKPQDQTTNKPAESPANVQRGSKGSDVKWVQQRLNSKGFGWLAEDGDFGSQTDKAVRNFQRSNGLKDDGIVGPLTRAKLA